MMLRQFANSLFFAITISSLAGCTRDHAEICEQPKDLTAYHITYNSASLKWNSNRPSGSYELQYKALDSLTWKVQMCSADSFTISGLRSLTAYQYKLIAHCGNLSSQASTLGTFTTDSLAHSVSMRSSFTPNGDGVNDTFAIASPIVVSADMQIYNRWGDKVYNSGPVASPSWDGKYQGIEQPAGTYFYSVTLVYIDGYVQHREGNLTLIR